MDNLTVNSQCRNECKFASMYFFLYFILKNGSDKKLKIPSKISLRIHFVRCIAEKKNEQIV